MPKGGFTVIQKSMATTGGESLFKTNPPPAHQWQKGDDGCREERGEPASSLILLPYDDLAAIDDVDALGEHKPTPVSSLKGRERGGLGDFSSAEVVDAFPSFP